MIDNNLDKLKLVGSQEELVITDCLEKIKYFCEYDAYRNYDLIGYEHEHQSNTIAAALLNATNAAMRARTSRKAWGPFIECPLAELDAVPSEVDLVDSSQEDYDKAKKSLWQCFEKITSVSGITDMAASKVLHLKRPKLVAISDRYVRKLLQIAEPSKSDYPSRSVYAARGLAVADAVRALGGENKDSLLFFQESLPKDLKLTKARILDILLWVDMAIPENQMWGNAAKERGWSSVGFGLWNQQKSRKLMNTLYNKIFDAGCVKFGEFKLKSGIMSPVYCDLRMLVSVPEVLAEIGKALGDKAKEIGCDRVAGIPYGGVPIAVAASIASGIPMIYPRKEVKDHGTRQSIEGTHNAGEKVLVIDDLVTSGMSFNEAVEPLKSAGLVVTDLLVILDREQGGAKVIEKAGYKLHSLIKLSGMTEALAQAGKIDREMQERVVEFIAKNQFS